MLDYSFFASRIGESFQVGDGPVRVTVETCERLKAYPGGGADPFSVMFVGPMDPVLAQKIHTLASERGERLEIFLVPVSRDASGTRYEAVFN